MKSSTPSAQRPAAIAVSAAPEEQAFAEVIEMIEIDRIRKCQHCWHNCHGPTIS